MTSDGACPIRPSCHEKLSLSCMFTRPGQAGAPPPIGPAGAPVDAATRAARGLANNPRITRRYGRVINCEVTDAHCEAPRRLPLYCLSHGKNRQVMT
ncbi:hypothetical protein PSEWESI4_01710 [Pseudomonas carbonaria]|uniref:Uncharacterized protein n=1 Tax=Zestomonas carbonaria TaxID=2762745 RepID=A0A7U7EMZ0_9GAMM|nr:hypothetical protein PSEWESI4_01710 [Pseudomonas carbonaria]